MAVGEVSTGTRVEVVNRFTASWSRGFVVAEVLETGYRVERLSDGCILPAVFSSADVRTYVFAVAPLMSAQLAPLRSQRRQWYVNAIVGAPTHVPLFAVRV